MPKDTKAPPDKQAEDRTAFDRAIAKGKEVAKNRGQLEDPLGQGLTEPAQEEERGESAPAEAEDRETKDDTVTAEEPQEEHQDADEDEEIKRARSFLRLKSSAPDTTIQALSSQDVLAWRNAIQERETNISRTFSENSELRQRLSDLEKQLQEREDAREAEQAVPAAELDLTPLEARLSRALGEDEGKSVAEALKAAIEPLQKRLIDQEKFLRDQVKRSEATVKALNRDRLSKAIPSLNDEDSWSDFQAAVEARLSRNGRNYRSVEDLYDATARALFGNNVLDGPGSPPRPAPEPEPDPRPAAEASPSPPRRKGTAMSPLQRIGLAKTDAEKKSAQRDVHYIAYKHLQKYPGDKRGALRAQGYRV